MRQFLAGALLLVTANTYAVSIDCVDYVGDIGNALNALDPSEGCQIGSQNNHSETIVNTDNLFNTNEWVELAKFDLGGGMQYSDPGPPPINVSFTTPYTDGELTIDWSNYLRDIAVVFKDGVGAPPYYVAHLLTAATYGGTGSVTYNFQSAFLNDLGGLKDISNLAFYSRTDVRTNPPGGPPGPTPVKLPSSLALMALGLLVARRRMLAT